MYVVACPSFIAAVLTLRSDGLLAEHAQNASQRQPHCKKAVAAENMAAKAAMAQGAPNYFTAEAMGFILAALFFNTLTAPVVKMTQNAEGGYDYNKWPARGVPFLVSRHRRDSCPSHEVVGGFFFDFEAVRTVSSEYDAPRR